MKTWKLILLLCLFYVKQAHAQGTMLFTWHGDSNYFQASFIVTDAEMQPGATFSSLEFTNSVHVDSLSGFTYNAKDDEHSFLGGLNPWGFHVTFVNFDTGMELLMRSLSFPYTGLAGSIQEKPMFGTELYYENGYWTSSAIPEPSIDALSIAALGCFFVMRRRAAS